MTTAKAYAEWQNEHVMVQLKAGAFLVAPDEGAIESLGISMRPDLSVAAELAEQFEKQEGRKPTNEEVLRNLPLLPVPPVPVLFGRLRVEGELVIMKLRHMTEDGEFAFELTIEPDNIQHVSRPCPRIHTP